jgi:uncharacterized protein (DUF2384 family)
MDQGGRAEAALAVRAIELYDVLTRAFRVFEEADAMRWLGEAEPYLGGRRPVDVLAAHGAAPVVVALETIHTERLWFSSRAH